MSIESRLKALEDMWDVAQVFYRYAASLDARDWESATFPKDEGSSPACRSQTI